MKLTLSPRGTGPFPLIVGLHGGACCRGDRLNDPVINEPLANGRMVATALDFRMPPAAPYPASLAENPDRGQEGVAPRFIARIEALRREFQRGGGTPLADVRREMRVPASRRRP